MNREKMKKAVVGRWSLVVGRTTIVDNALRSRKRRAFILHASYFILFFSILFSSAIAHAQQGPEFLGIRVGLGDRYKAGLWTPVELTIRGGSVPLTGLVAVTVPDGDGIPSRVVPPPKQVNAGEIATVRLCVRFGRVQSDLEAEFLVDGKIAAHKTFKTALSTDETHFLAALEEQPLLVAVGNSKLGLEEAAKLRDSAAGDPNRTGEHRTEIARVGNVEQLPLQWQGYEGVDALVIATSDAEMFRKLAPGDARVKALDDWIQMGGRLVLCIGSQADEALAANSALARFAPGRFDRIVPRRQTAVWEQFCGSTQPMPQPKEGGTISIACAKLLVEEGVEAREDDLPLVVRTPRGLGQIIFVAADIDRPPFSDWSDRGLLWAKLLDFTLARGNEKPDEQYQGGYGYGDLSGQLRSALDAFTGVKVIPFALVAMMIVGYLLLIGPGDYFLLKKAFRRMQWTWFTFPLMVIVVSFTAYWLANYLKGDRLRVNQVDLVDVDVATKTIRGTTWLNLFSPRMESFDLSLQPVPPKKSGEAEKADSKMGKNATGYFAWFGLPGSGLGGMNPHGGGGSTWSQPYRLRSEAELNPSAASDIENVPIQVWATKSFTGRWRTEAEVVPRADLTDEQQDLVGSITNPYDFPLTNCIIVHDHWVYYEVGDKIVDEAKNEFWVIKPGGTAQLSASTKRNDLQHYLTGFHMVKEGKDTPSQKITPFEMYNRDTSYILRFMMFYEAAGGRKYTHLANDYQSFVDLSNLLKTGRAILVADALQNANAAKHGAILLRKNLPLARDEDRHAVIYRFVFPVKKK
jgi:hypothetical protein